MILGAIADSKPVRGLLAALASLDRVVAGPLERLCVAGMERAERLWEKNRPYVQRKNRPYVQRAAAVVAGRLRAAAVIVTPWIVRFAGLFSWSTVMGLLAAGCAAQAMRMAADVGHAVLTKTMGLAGAQVAQLAAPEFVKTGGVLSAMPAILALALLLCVLGTLTSLLAFVRSRLSLWLLKATAAAYTVLVLTILSVAWRLPKALHADSPELFLSDVRNELWVKGTVSLLPRIALAVVFLFFLVLRTVTDFYRKTRTEEPSLGDRIWQNLRTHGRDPRFRKAVYYATALHIFVIFILPFLPFGCMERPYGIPKGSGMPVLQVVQIKRVKKKKEKEYIFNMDTAISFYVPKIEDSEVFEDVEKLTENIYEAVQEGKLGEGGGKKGGWPDGMEDAKVRFIRLEYDGGDWDQDMGVDSDYNLLLQFREMTGFNIWHETEHKRAKQLLRFPKKRAPPFVYLTGGPKGNMSFSQSEIRAIRQYCLEMGGMVFADNGGGNFDRHFRSLMQRTFPDLPLVEIAYDDVMFQRPFVFPNGAPPLWHHSGNRAMGVKHRGRWVVFYHQGDINDAWKSGHSGVSEGLAAQAYKLGVNVINYAFTQYLQINFGK